MLVSSTTTVSTTTAKTTAEATTSYNVGPLYATAVGSNCSCVEANRFVVRQLNFSHKSCARNKIKVVF